MLHFFPFGCLLADLAISLTPSSETGIAVRQFLKPQTHDERHANDQAVSTNNSLPSSDRQIPTLL
jgi:hypothetical protein